MTFPTEGSTIARGMNTRRKSRFSHMRSTSRSTKLQKFIREGGSWPQLLAEVQPFFRNTMFDHGREQASLALEVAVNEAFRTAGRRGNFASGRYLITLGREQSQGGPNECLFLSGPIPRPLRTSSVPVLLQIDQLARPVACPLRLVILSMPVSLKSTFASDGTIAPKSNVITSSIFCKKIVRNLSRDRVGRREREIRKVDSPPRSRV